MNKNRSHEAIIADILSIVAKEPRKTHIMYKANLSYALLCKYLDKLVAAGLIRYRENDRVYELAPKGEVYLEKYAEYKRLRTQLEINISSLGEKEDLLTKILDTDLDSLDLKKLTRPRLL